MNDSLANRTITKMLWKKRTEYIHVALKYREKRTKCWHVLAATGWPDPDKQLYWVPWDPREPSATQMVSI